ncbi:ACD11 homolog protein-like [Zingiber officinale]|uniref:Glycolipid transfer protein domain-containing protein n=1 Tax=Zingiber officinale TaxID=94328 RepID=A0A8J5GER8_ZINOF|nr:ACD11 homolog protein-like [Zingiber officinale]KAG6498797.1 hypothetical protein ZIOFF_038519 [Zingiber officinale]
MGEETPSDPALEVGAAAARPLAVVAAAFEDISRMIDGDGEGPCDLRLAPFSSACSLVTVLFGCLGFAFKFAELEYSSKVNDLIEASNTYDTLSSILEHDIANDSVRKQGSHSRNLRRVRLGLDLIKALFEQYLSSSDCSLKEAASTAYDQVCAPFHAWTIRKAVGAGMYALPTRDQLLLRLNETDASVKKEMEKYIDSSRPVIEYIDNLFLSRNITLDW